MTRDLRSATGNKPEKPPRRYWLGGFLWMVGFCCLMALVGVGDAARRDLPTISGFHVAIAIVLALVALVLMFAAHSIWSTQDDV